jgi:hypothetical protein
LSPGKRQRWAGGKKAIALGFKQFPVWVIPASCIQRKKERKQPASKKPPGNTSPGGFEFSQLANQALSPTTSRSPGGNLDANGLPAGDIEVTP